MQQEKPEPTKRPKKRGGNGASVAVDPEAFLAATDGARSDRKLQVGEIVFRQGEPADAVFYIEKGEIQLTVVSEQGRKA